MGFRPFSLKILENLELKKKKKKKKYLNFYLKTFSKKNLKTPGKKKKKKKKKTYLNSYLMFNGCGSQLLTISLMHRQNLCHQRPETAQLHVICVVKVLSPCSTLWMTTLLTRGFPIFLKKMV